jgi:hypothetical protein
MERTADHSIQGYLYQLHKALLEILDSADDAEVTVEGLVEDVEIKVKTGLKAIQCKYHETKEVYTASAIYKPVLQMMEHFRNNLDASIQYVLFAHFPNPPQVQELTAADLEAAIATKDKTLKKYADAIRGNIDYTKFLQRFTLHFGQSYDDLVILVQAALQRAGIDQHEVATLFYPNAIHAIAALSIKHDVKMRSVTKIGLLERLQKIRTTAITRWTLALKTKKQLLEAKRKQLKANLDKNARLRYLLVDTKTLDDFDEAIVGFVCDFLEKYHFKEAHVCTPLLCLNATEAVFRDIQLRLYRKGVISNDGFVGPNFDESYFFRQPMSAKDAGVARPRREFTLRLLRWEEQGSLLARQKPDDLFIIGASAQLALDTKDVAVEPLETSTVKEIAYLMGVSPTYE